MARCKCFNRTGTTDISCCNNCGEPVEHWECGPLGLAKIAELKAQLEIANFKKKFAEHSSEVTEDRIKELNKIVNGFCAELGVENPVSAMVELQAMKSQLSDIREALSTLLECSEACGVDSAYPEAYQAAEAKAKECKNAN